MAIRDWSGRRLAAVWAVGLALEAGLVAFSALHSRRAEAEHRRQWEATFGPAAGARRLTRAERDSVLRTLSDSAGVTLRTSGDQLIGVELSPDAEAKAGRVLEALGRAVMVATLLAAAVYLTIPVGLLALTGIWVAGRRRRAAVAVTPAT